MIDLRGSDTVRVTKVKGHADEGMVSDGRVRELDRLGNNAADEAADFGHRRVGPGVIDAVIICLVFVVAAVLFFLIYIGSLLLFLERLVIMMGLVVLPPDPMVWSAGSLPKRRVIVHAVRNLAMLPGPPALWVGEWVASPSVAIDADDVAHWPFAPGLLVKWVSFLRSLHWPVHGGDLGVGGISYVELVSFCMNFGLGTGWFSKKLILGIFGQGAQFQCRLFLLVQALIFGALVVLLVL